MHQLVLRLEVAFAKSSHSNKATLYPLVTASTATPKPVAPPPITTTSQTLDGSEILDNKSSRFIVILSDL